MKGTILLVALFCFTLAARQHSEYKSLWSKFKVDHGRKFSTIGEDQRRFQIFRNNVDLIDRLNKQHNPRTQFGITQFTDMTKEEKQKFFNPLPERKSHPQHPQFNLTNIPKEVDWRKNGAVTPVTNQGQCGSSPYWSAVVSMEGAWAIAGHPLVALSTQQILDCSGNWGNAGCNGGEMTYSFQYVIDVGGIESAADYPYTGGVQGNCTFDKRKVVAKFSSYVSLPGDEGSFTAALSIVPVATAVNAAVDGFEYYTGGVFSSADCNTIPPNHGIGVVGYGVTASGQQYYILKNTWGQAWGEKGFMYLARNQGNMCGVASYGTYIKV